MESRAASRPLAGVPLSAPRVYPRRKMQVSQVAYDRYVVELPPAEADWRPLGDPETVAETAMWLWAFGPTPRVGVVGHNGAVPSWLTSWSPRDMKWAPQGATASSA